MIEKERKMIKIKCMKCDRIGYSATNRVRCKCGGECKEIVISNGEHKPLRSRGLDCIIL